LNGADADGGSIAGRVEGGSVALDDVVLDDVVLDGVVLAGVVLAGVVLDDVVCRAPRRRANDGLSSTEGTWRRVPQNRCRKCCIIRVENRCAVRHIETRFCNTGARHMTTATFDAAYAGKVTVTLNRVGKGWLWIAEGCVHCGYKPVPSAARAINNARHDRRFSDVREG
jgi:hypothetical protein